MPFIQLNKRTIEAIALADAGQVLYRDTELRGFGLRVGSASKVFFVEAQVAARTVRSTIGKYGPLTPDLARKLALQKLSSMAQGRDPNAERRRDTRRQLTLSEAFEQFFVARANLSPRTVDSYRRSVRLYLGEWAGAPLRDVTRAMVLARHRELAATRGEATANSVMRHLRSVYNTAAAGDDDMPGNPVAVLTQGARLEVGEATHAPDICLDPAKLVQSRDGGAAFVAGLSLSSAVYRHAEA